MDEQAASRPAAPQDTGFHDDDELAAALSAQLERLIETGAIPVARERSAPAVAARADEAVAPRADEASAAVAPPPVAARSEPVTEPAPSPVAARPRATTPATPTSAQPAPVAAARAAHAAAPSDVRPAPGWSAPAPATGSTPAVPPPSHRAEAPAPRPSEPTEHRGEHRADHPPVRATHRGTPPPVPPPMPDFVDLPETAPISLPHLSQQEPALPQFLTGPVPTAAPADGPALPSRRARRLQERAAAGDTGSVDLPARAIAQPAAAAGTPEQQPAAEDDEADEAEPPDEVRPRSARAAASGSADPWSQSLRIVGLPGDDDELDEPPVAAEGPPTTGPVRFDEPLPTTGSIVVPIERTEPELPEIDEDAEIDEVESDYKALAADTASVGVLPPMVHDSGHHVVPAVSRESLDRERVPEAVRQPPVPASNAGILAPLSTWAGATGSPLAIVVGFGLGGGTGTLVGLLIGLGLALPAVLRLATLGARHGGDAVAAARGALGIVAGTVSGVVLLVARLAVAALGLLGVAEVATSYAGRTGVGGSLPASGAAIVAVLVAGLLALAAASWPAKVVGVLLGAAGAIAVFASTALLAVAAGAAGSPGGADSPVGGAVAGFALVGLVVAAGGAEVTRRPLSTTRWPGAVAGTVLGAVGGLAVIALGAAVAGAGGADAADRFLGNVVDATSIALVGPIAVLLLLGSLALIATATRAAGSAAVSLLGHGRSTVLGTAASTLVAIAAALAALAAGFGASDALARFGPLVAVPLTAVLAAVVAGPRARVGGTGRGPLLVLGVAVLAGLLLVDGLLVPGERGPLLDLLGLPTTASWRAVPVIGLLVATIGGAVAGLLAHDRTPDRADDRTEQLDASTLTADARK